MQISKSRIIIGTNLICLAESKANAKMEYGYIDKEEDSNERTKKEQPFFALCLIVFFQRLR